MMIRILLILLISYIPVTCISQPQKSNKLFILPLDIPIYLSGNFAELRSGHFHSGIDIKTNGTEGEKLLSIEDGYVSRIKVQTNGYGKSVYINHPGGYTSLYGHLLDYNNIIADYVKKYQYRNKTHTLDIYPGKNEIQVKKGELIGFTGNSGSSSGPHLHFEIRNATNQHPTNVLKYYNEIYDNIPPRLYSFYTYQFRGTGKDKVIGKRNFYKPLFSGNEYFLRSPIHCLSPVGFGIEAFDFINGSGNRCGLYSVEMFINNELFYHFQTDEFSFYETRYINAHSDYELKNKENKKVQYLFKKPNNPLSMYKYLKNDGILVPDSGKEYNIQFVLKDVKGNISKLNFTLIGAEKNSETALKSNKEEILFKWYEKNEFKNSQVQFYLPSATLYENMNFNYSVKSRDNANYPFIHILGDDLVPMHKYADLMFNIKNIPGNYKNKALIIRIENEKISPEGGIVSDEWLIAKVRDFGRYTVEIDTIPPEINPINFYPGKDMSTSENIKFVIKDELSGIENYTGYINNEWVLFEYDPKNNLLTHRFDDAGSGKKLNNQELEIYITDERGNKSMYHAIFKR